MTLIIDDSAVKRIEELRTAQSKDSLMLRITVDGGGCSGFQYKLELTEDTTDKDKIFDNAVIADDISMPFLNGSTVKFDQGLIGSEFKIENPNAVSGCGCGTSFSV
ncbi:MAG: iron-sulfur cluster assembly accessory protein [Alphaproteobacteria bacterium]|nr:iron-sulfur cluster assembly accessory protein [Alphaproteobacteria bacterium]